MKKITPFLFGKHFWTPEFSAIFHYSIFSIPTLNLKCHFLAITNENIFSVSHVLFILNLFFILIVNLNPKFLSDYSSVAYPSCSYFQYITNKYQSLLFQASRLFSNTSPGNLLTSCAWGSDREHYWHSTLSKWDMRIGHKAVPEMELCECNE